MIPSIDNPVKIGIVGLNFGRHIMRRDLLEGPGGQWFKVHGITDLSEALAHEVSLLHNLPVYPSLEAMLADPEIEAIGLYTPPAGRAKLVEKCLNAGKAIMATKPFEVDPAEAAIVLDKAAGLGVPVHMNSPSPLPGADTAQILAWQQEFSLGRIVAAHFETYSDYHEQADGRWLDDAELCPAAPIFRIGIYGINELISLLGPVDSVAVAASRLRTGRPTPDNAELMMRFKNGAIGTVFCSMCIKNGRPHTDSLLLHFERGSISRNICGGPYPSESKGAALSLEYCDLDDTIKQKQIFYPHTVCSGAYQWENFYRAIRSGEKFPDNHIVEGIQVIQAMKRAEKSDRFEKVIAKEEDILCVCS